MNLVLGLFRQQTGAGEFCYLTMINVSHEPDINGLIWWQPPARSPIPSQVVGIIAFEASERPDTDTESI